MTCQCLSMSFLICFLFVSNFLILLFSQSLLSFNCFLGIHLSLFIVVECIFWQNSLSGYPIIIIFDLSQSTGIQILLLQVKYRIFISIQLTIAFLLLNTIEFQIVLYFFIHQILVIHEVTCSYPLFFLLFLPYCSNILSFIIYFHFNEITLVFLNSRSVGYELLVFLHLHICLFPLLPRSIVFLS